MSSDETKEEKPVSWISEVVSFFKTIIILLIIAILIRGTVVEAFKIPSGSMIPTLQIGDHILVSKFNFGLRLPFIKTTLFQYATPKRGDIVVFTRPNEEETIEDESAINIIKRVIGLPGETIEVRGTQTFIDGNPIDEPYARWVSGGILEGNYGPVKIPEDSVILLGDNRDRSKDSRFWSYHFLPIKLIKGKAFVIYWSWDNLSRIGTLVK